jgi:hypothetical protein
MNSKRNLVSGIPSCCGGGETPGEGGDGTEAPVQTQNYVILSHRHNYFMAIHCKKGLAVFPSPTGMSQTKLSLGGNN